VCYQIAQAAAFLVGALLQPLGGLPRDGGAQPLRFCASSALKRTQQQQRPFGAERMKSSIQCQLGWSRGRQLALRGLTKNIKRGCRHQGQNKSKIRYQNWMQIYYVNSALRNSHYDDLLDNSPTSLERHFRANAGGSLRNSSANSHRPSSSIF